MELISPSIYRLLYKRDSSESLFKCSEIFFTYALYIGDMETTQTSRRLAAWRREWLIDRKLREVDEQEAKELNSTPSSEPLPPSLFEVAPFDSDPVVGDILLFSRVHTPDFDFPLHAVVLNPDWADDGEIGSLAPISWMGEPATMHEYKCIQDLGPWRRVISCDLGFSAKWSRLKFWKAGRLTKQDMLNAHEVFKSWISGSDLTAEIEARTCPVPIEDDDDPRIAYQDEFMAGLQPLINHGQPMEEEEDAL